MDNLTNFEKLKAAISVFSTDPVIAKLDKAFVGEGVDITSESENVVLGDGGIFYVDANGILTRVVVYIVDKKIDDRYSINLKESITKYGFDADEVVKDLHKYHVANCTTLLQAEKAGWRKYRYKMSRRKDGEFFYRLLNANDIFHSLDNQRLNVCKNCLKAINEVSENVFTVNNFNIEEFFKQEINVEKAPGDVEYGCDSAPNIYSGDWRKVSERYRQLKNYQCENTGCPFSDLSAHSFHKYLHVHHVAHDKNNNQYSNLQALCIYCHANQAKHERMKSLPDYRQYIKMRGITA